MQVTFEFVTTSPPAPLPEVWSRLNDEERAAAVAMLARLMARTLEQKEKSDE